MKSPGLVPGFFAFAFRSNKKSLGIVPEAFMKPVRFAPENWMKLASLL